MIICPDCGAANPEGSAVCTQCGSSLAEGARRCPMCGALNPRENILCEQCQARLVPLGGEGALLGADTGAAEQGKPSEEGPREPDWLTELRATVEETEVGEEETGIASFLAEEAAAEEEEAEPVEVPEWFREVVMGPAEEPEAPEEPSVPAEEVPDWLKEVLPEVGAAPSAEAGEEPAGEPPPEEAPPAEWAVETEAELPSIPPGALGEVGEETPEEGEWLAEAEARIGTGPFTEELVAEEAVEATGEEGGEAALAEEAPEWLRELEAGAPEEVEPEEQAEAPEEAELPEWLLKAAEEEEPTEEAEVPQVEPGAATPVFITEEGVPSVEPGEVPDWLRELGPPARATEVPPVEALEGIEGLVPAEIPAWLEALRPSEEGPQEPPETEGLLEGLGGTLRPSPAVEATGGPVSVPSVTARPASLARAELLQELLSRPMAPKRRVRKEKGRGLGQALARLLIGLLILVAILAPMAGIRISGSGANPSVGSPFLADVEAAYRAVEERVDSGTPVLIAFEYGPSEAEEMERVAGPLVRHVVQKGGRLLLVSTRPEGPALAERLVRGLIAAGERVDRVANLGYQPGGTAGVQGLLGNLARRGLYASGEPAARAAAMEGVTTVEDVGLVVVLAGQVEDVRGWVEQVASRGSDLAVVAGVSARVEPTARPYLGAVGRSTLRGLVSGLAGADVYEDLIGVDDQRTAFYLESLSLAQWSVALLMVVGALIFLITGEQK